MHTDAGSRILFLDLDGIERQHNVALAVTQATKHPLNPVLPLGDLHEWDSTQANLWASRTVIYDDEERIFKAWYQGTDVALERWWATGYAVSDDGVHWEKPRLGLHAYQGSTENNIVYPGWGPVMKDGAEPDPAKRYKLIANGPPRDGEIRLVTSPDGLHWTEGPRIQLPAWGQPARDIVVIMRDDAEPNPARRYKLVWQALDPANKPGPERVRTKHLAFGPDFEHLTNADFNPILTPNDGLEQENHFLMLERCHTHYVMLYEYGWYVPNRLGVFGQYAADIRLAVSRDGERFVRVQPQQQVIPRGPHGAFDSQILVIAHRPVVKDDTIYLYYGSGGDDWMGWPPRFNLPERYRQVNTGSIRLSRLGLATLPIDGFTHLRSADDATPGYFVTRPIGRTDRHVELQANLDRTIPQRDWIEIEVLDAERDEPVPGFTRDDCVDLARDGVRVPVRWREAGLRELDRDRFRLRVWIIGAARLFALGFEAH